MTDTQDPTPCAHCHREAFETITRNGEEIRLCPSCACWASLDAPAAEPVPEYEPDDVQGPCEDCHTREAVTVFYSLDGRRAQLCIPCSALAEQDDQCRMFCMCHTPTGGYDERCTQCHFRIPEAVEEEWCAECGEHPATVESSWNDDRYCADCFWELREHWRYECQHPAIGAGAGPEESESEGGGDPCRHCGRDGQYGLCQYCDWARQDRFCY